MLPGWAGDGKMIVNKCFVFRFSDIEVHENEFRATRAGQPLEIEPKAFRVLVYLVRHAGHLVTKNELIQAVWGDTAVTDNSLTRAIALLRRTLEDDPHQPRFIETVSTAGYRFICPVEPEGDPGKPAAVLPPPSTGRAAEELPPAVATNTPTSPTVISRTNRRRIWFVSGAVALLLACGAGVLWYSQRPLPPPRVSNYTRLTLDGWKKDVVGTDGNSLFLNLVIVDPDGIGQLPLTGGNVVHWLPDLPESALLTGETPRLFAVSPDGGKLLVGGHVYPGRQLDLWVVGTLGRPARLLARATNATWSPDGKQIIYTSSRGDLYTVASDGGSPRLLLASTAPEGALHLIRDIAWSPDATRIRFTRDHTIWEIAADGTNLHQLLPGWLESHPSCCGRWTPDGNFFLFLSENTLVMGPLFLPGGQIWGIDERRGPLGQRNSKSFALAGGPTLWGTPIPSRDGKHIFARGVDLRGELVRFDRKSNQLKPYLGGISAEFLSFSQDGKYVVYVTFPEGVLWRANRDGTGVVQLTRPPVYPKNPRFSPDDKSIAFHDYSAGLRDAIYIMSAEGGTPQRVLSDFQSPHTDPDWSPDGKRMVFSTRAAFSAGPRGETRVHIVNLTTHEIETIPPRLEGFEVPFWSPDGRYLIGVNRLNTDVIVFDLQTRQFSTIFDGADAGFPRLSRDGRFVYLCGRLREGPLHIFRIPLTGGKAELVADLRDFRWTGWYGSWIGLDPDDNPLMLRDVGTDEIYALTLER